MSGWQPIETAPKDTFVLVYMPWTGLVRQAKLQTKGPGILGWRVAWNASNKSVVAQTPSHWHPLPEPPIVNPIDPEPSQ